MLQLAMIMRCAFICAAVQVVVFTCGYQSSPCLVLVLTLATGGAKLGQADLASALYWLAASALSLLGVLVLTAYLCMSSEAAAVLAEADARVGALLGPTGKAGYVHVGGLAEEDAVAAEQGEVESLLFTSSGDSDFEEDGGKSPSNLR